MNPYLKQQNIFKSQNHINQTYSIIKSSYQSIRKKVNNEIYTLMNILFTKNYYHTFSYHFKFTFMIQR